MKVKVCIKCNCQKPIDEFYKHKRMADGRLGKCKACCCRDNSENRKTKREKYAAYERERFKDPERKKRVLLYQKKRRMKNPEKNVARAMVWKALISGELVRKPCEICGAENSEAHHTDYSRPLDVQWLCFKHHREIGHGQVCTK